MLQFVRLPAVFSARRWISIFCLPILLLFAIALVPTQAQGESGPTLGLQQVVSGLSAPVDLESLPGGSGQMLVVDQTGVIYLLNADGQLQDQPFLDIRDRLVELNPQYDERGLLGLAFHPNFTENGRFFVYYSAPLRDGGPDGWSNTNRVAEFTVDPSNPTQVDPSSERILLEIDEPQSNHNGGDIVFGPDDGYLYIPTGDGGGADDDHEGHTPDMGNAQDLTKILGKILRIDVDNGDPYSIPSDNPYSDNEMYDLSTYQPTDSSGASGNPLPEIWAYGFRNPWRMSFDSGGDHSLYVGDAGQELWEEIDLVTAGNNYGWRLLEGYHCFDHENPMYSPRECRINGYNDEALHLPILEYSHLTGQVVIGGYVYRGSALSSDMQGMYIFGDYSGGSVAGYSGESAAGLIFVAEPPPDGAQDSMWHWQTAQVSVDGGTASRTFNQYVKAFAEDDSGELYVLTSQNQGPSGDTGTVWRIVPAQGQGGAEGTQEAGGGQSQQPEGSPTPEATQSATEENGQSDTAQAQQIDVTETSYGIQLSANSASAGTITFSVSNQADQLDHELVIIKTDLDAGDLPLDADGNVDESQVQVVDEVEGIAPGTSKELTVQLEPGHYVLICNLPGHYSEGMYVEFTVNGASGDQSSQSSSSDQAQGEPIQVSLVDYDIEMPDQIANVAGGPVIFEVTNNGETTHNFEIQGNGIDRVFDENLEPGETKTMQIDDLAPGQYRVFCPVANHASLGMDIQITVNG